MFLRDGQAGNSPRSCAGGQLRILLLAFGALFASCQAGLPEPNTGVSDSRGGAGAAGAFPQGALVDLSHAYDEQTVFWPTAEGFKLEKVAEGQTPGGYYYAANNFSTAEHGGTHLDAPIHFAAGRHTADEIPLERLIGAGVVVDVTDKCAADRDYQITVEDFQRWEAEHGQLPRDVILLLRTGTGRHWPDRERYMGTSERGEAAVAKLHFPGLHPDAARWLVANRPIKSIGLDTPSIDYGQSKLFESHRVLFDRNIPAFENLANLDRLPAKGFHVVALPMKIRNGSGGPLRAVAIVPPAAP
jgi:kynurenine formamidase